MVVYNIAVLVFLFSFLVILVWNLLIIRRRCAKDEVLKDFPFVSILVPMRNEEQNAEPCLTSLLNLDYPKFEVIALDDDSTDNTKKILYDLQKKYKKLKIIENNFLPEGWIGKSWACKLLTDQSTGEYLLFTDADTIHKTESLKKIMNCMNRYDSDLISILPEQKLVTFPEKLLVPFLYFVLAVFLPMFMIKYNKFPRFSAAIGQYLLFKRAAYEKIGGHEAVRNSIIEDLHLARLIKQNNLKLTLLDGSDLVTCRMYRELNEIITGFTKNMFAGLGKSLPVMIFSVILSAILFFMPFALSIITLFGVWSNSFILYLLFSQIIVIYTMRLLLSVRFKQGFLSPAMHPVGMLMLYFILFYSYWSDRVKGITSWKGRIYKEK